MAKHDTVEMAEFDSRHTVEFEIPGLRHLHGDLFALDGVKRADVDWAVITHQFRPP